MLHRTHSKPWLALMTAACGLTVSVSARPFLAQIPAPVGLITGTVIDARSQKPVIDATVTLSLVGQERVPGAGITTLDDVPPAYRREMTGSGTFSTDSGDLGTGFGRPARRNLSPDRLNLWKTYLTP